MKLFLFGHARTGSTVTQNLLNAHPSVYLLGEAQLHLYQSDPSFRQKYNQQHSDEGKQKSKSTYLPALCGQHGTGEQFLEALQHHYSFVGDKIALSGEWGLQQIDPVFEYLMGHHLDAKFVITMRAPLACLGSCWKKFPSMDPKFYVASYAGCMGAVIDILCIAQNVHFTFLEDSAERRIAALETFLGLKLKEQRRMLTKERQSGYSTKTMPSPLVPAVAAMEILYASFRKSVSNPSELAKLQLEEYLIAGVQPVQSELARLRFEFERLKTSFLTQATAAKPEMTAHKIALAGLPSPIGTAPPD